MSPILADYLANACLRAFGEGAIAGEKVPLSEKKEYIVGRKNCDILIESDDSISRKHAVIRVKDDHVTIEDCKSKYHTLRNGVKIRSEVEVRLQHMDSIQFGVLNSKFSFESYTVVTAASALSVDRKKELKKSIVRCNGKFVEKWSSSCTHLTVEKITLTIKVLQALIDEKPIVTPEYWLKYAESLENMTALPDINLYNKPPVAEQLLRSDFQYQLDARRKTLFDGKMFVFLKSNIRKQMEDVIKSCGGECIDWEEDGPRTFYDIMRSPKEHLIVRADSDEENVSFSAIVKDMAKQKKRVIPLNEIALAIVHCSCDINCNPDFNKVTEVFGAHTQKQQTMGILAADTQSECMSSAISGIKAEKVIPSSVEDDWMSNVPEPAEKDKGNGKETAGPSGLKRRSDDRDDAADKDVFKKPKIEEEEKNTNKKKENAARIEITVSAPQRDANDAGKDQYIKSKPQPSQKRKADDDLQPANSRNVNPFSLIALARNKKNKIDDQDNPFELTRGSSSKPSLPSKSPTKKYENPFARIPILSNSTNNSSVTVKDERLKPKQPKREIILLPNKSDFSTMSTMKRSMLNNSSWMWKTNTNKREVIEMNSELLEITKAFKDCVKVEILPLFNRTASVNNISVDRVDGKRNFKKFKKVQPVKPQVTIIPRHHLTKVAPGEIAGIDIGIPNNSDNDENGPTNSSHAKQKAKRKVKKYVL